MELPSHLKKYEAYSSEEELLEELFHHPNELLSFLLQVITDTDWILEHSEMIKKILEWITAANINRNFPDSFFSPLVVPIQKFLQGYIPKDLTLQASDNLYQVNSFLVGQYSVYFQRRINQECRHKSPRFLNVSEIPSYLLPIIDEYITTGEYKDLWKTPPDELWIMIEDLSKWSFISLIEKCEEILCRYIDRYNATDVLVKAHQNSLQLLQDASIDFINLQETHYSLHKTPVEFLAFEFKSFHTSAIEIFDLLSPYITHLIFSKDLLNDLNFKIAVNKCPELVGLDLRDSQAFSDYLIDLPEQIRELGLSHCRWTNSQALKIVTKSCPHLKKLDLSSNDHIPPVMWGDLQYFKELAVLNISRCFQITDRELRIVLQAAPGLFELDLTDCHRISPDGFFEIGLLSPDLSILNISKTSISDAGLIDVMTRCKYLYIVDLSRCSGISDKGVLEGIRARPSLKKIVLNGGLISTSGLELIKNSFPYLNVVIV